MKAIELTDEQYAILLTYKNFITRKIYGVTNPEVLRIWENEPSLYEGIDGKMDFQPEYTFGECIIDTIGSVKNEQETGEVNYIT